MERGREALAPCAARPEFVNLSESEVWKAIACDDECANPVTAEVTRLALGFMALFKACVERRGHAPHEMMPVKVRCPIEKVAVLMVVTFLDEQASAMYRAPVH
jgi:hypothetical protein